MLEIFDRPAGSDMSMWGTVKVGQANTSCYPKVYLWLWQSCMFSAKRILITLQNFSLKKSEMCPKLSQMSSNQHRRESGMLKSHSWSSTVCWANFSMLLIFLLWVLHFLKYFQIRKDFNYKTVLKEPIHKAVIAFIFIYLHFIYIRR